MKVTKILIILIINTLLLSACNSLSSPLAVYELTSSDSQNYETSISEENVLRAISEVIDSNEDSISIEDITIDELWENSKQEIFRISVDNKWIDSIAIFQDSKLLHILAGQDINKVIIADLNSDGIYEVCMTSNYGSGIVRSILKVYETKEKKEYKYESDLNLDDIVIKDINIEANYEDNEVDVYLKDWSTRENDTPIVVYNVNVDENQSNIEETDMIGKTLEFRGDLLGKLTIDRGELKILH